ncbi:hypothetical protein IFM89_002782 [Coptis chinensis]|uniref:Uncharacterized protein n=1 Tax=Coptis chinensis TaxID=261450 RepID=A0A835HTT3_9MAGN|nr:hypothetical protein IFM89_002782 [Coptis chinensis]
MLSRELKEALALVITLAVGVDENGRPLYGDVFGLQQQKQLNYEEEPVDRSKHWGDLEEEEEIEEEELEDGIQSLNSLSSTPTGVETPDVIDLRRQQRKEYENRYVNGDQDKAAAAKRVDLLRGQKADKVDVTLRPEELEGVELKNVLAAKYEEAREEEKLRSQREDFSDMVAENEKKRKRKREEGWET